MEINTLFAVKTTNCLQENGRIKRIKSNQLSIGTCNPAGITHGCRAGMGWTRHSKRALPDLFCTKLTVESSCWASPATAFPACLGSPLAGNQFSYREQNHEIMEQTRQDRWVQHLYLADTISLARNSTHLGQDSWYYCPSPTPCTSSDAYVTPKTWQKQSTNNKDNFPLVEGLCGLLQGWRKHNPPPHHHPRTFTPVSLIISTLPSRTS